MDLYNRSARVQPQETRRQIEAAGLVDFKEETFKCYINPWHTNTRKKEVARWFNLGLTMGLEALSFMPLINNLGYSQEGVEELCARAKKEACALKNHTYFNV